MVENNLIYSFPLKYMYSSTESTHHHLPFCGGTIPSIIFKSNKTHFMPLPDWVEKNFWQNKITLEKSLEMANKGPSEREWI